MSTSRSLYRDHHYDPTLFFFAFARWPSTVYGKRQSQANREQLRYVSELCTKVYTSSLGLRSDANRA
nr:hypothetical protein CFP56_25790 [Quercus suber]